MKIKSILIGAALAASIAATVPTAANAAVFKTETQAESFMTRDYSDFYEDDSLELDSVDCDGFGRYRDGGDGAEDRYRKFKCVSEYSDVDGEYGVTDTDSLKARKPGFKLHSIDHETWGDWGYESWSGSAK